MFSFRGPFVCQFSILFPSLLLVSVVVFSLFFSDSLSFPHNLSSSFHLVRLFKKNHSAMVWLRYSFCYYIRFILIDDFFLIYLFVRSFIYVSYDIIFRNIYNNRISRCHLTSRRRRLRVAPLSMSRLQRRQPSLMQPVDFDWMIVSIRSAKWSPTWCTLTFLIKSNSRMKVNKYSTI